MKLMQSRRTIKRDCRSHGKENRKHKKEGKREREN